MTIFLEVQIADYYKLVDTLCFAINATHNMATSEKNVEVANRLNEEALEVEAILSKLGEQAYGQLPHLHNHDQEK